MFHTDSNFRLILEIVCGVILISFIGGIMLLAALAVGLPMALGMIIVFSIEYYKRKH